jgi:hypothetical protein
MNRRRFAARTPLLIAVLATSCNRHYLVNESVLAVAKEHARQQPEDTIAVPAVRQEDRSRVVFVYSNELVREDAHRAHAFNNWWVGSAFFFGMAGAGLVTTVGLLVEAKVCTDFLCSFGPNLGATIAGGVGGLLLLAGIATVIVATRAHPSEVKPNRRGVVYLGADGVIHF